MSKTKARPRWMAAAALLLCSTVALAAPAVRIRGGNVEYRDGQGDVRAVTSGRGYSQAVLSADGSRMAFIHVDKPSRTEGVPDETSLWIADVASGRSHRLLAPKLDTDDPKHNLASFQRPRFSLDGAYVYIDAEAWTTSNAVHQVNVLTGAERFVAAGSNLGVIRTGPYRGYLLVAQHKYHPAPAYGSYDPVMVIRPDGTEILMVPGSDKDDGERSVPAWLARTGAEAW